MKNEETEGNIDLENIEGIKRHIKEREADLQKYRGQRLLTKLEIEENRRHIMKLLFPKTDI